jgi:RHH-type proline utilization regulon transcriptional repressor/proline dehydrogenase/delta 1-pyrroline-5-carboxylate dehydrogenase
MEMTMTKLDLARDAVRARILADDAETIGALIESADLSQSARVEISARAEKLVEAVRRSGKSGLMESFLSEYGLATDEGVALMSLAEALLRVPDSATIDALINDKVGSSDWDTHAGSSKSPFVNFSTWALALTSDVLGVPETGPMAALQNAIKRLGEPVIRVAVSNAMKLLGSQFVFGRTIEEATRNAKALEKTGYRFSYDMLGEAARTAPDAAHYFKAYSDAIKALSIHCKSASVRDNPGISIKLSALHPRYEFAKRERVMTELIESTLALAIEAHAANMGFNIDAEEADRLDLSLDIIAAVLADERLAGWDGFGVVVQAYGKRVVPLIDWLDTLAENLDRKIMVRLVKGAYWDAEIKRAQVLGLESFPVFTRKASTDISYIAAAKRLFASGRIYPQFATHNAHTASAVLHLARAAGRSTASFEFQRLHGMGERLHDVLKAEEGTQCRIYAPVGAHKDLLAYLVRRLLENGANGSFVYQIADEGIPAKTVAQDPFAKVLALGDAVANPAIATPAELFGAERVNSRGWDITDPLVMPGLDREREKFRTHQWTARPLIAGDAEPGPVRAVHNPAIQDDVVGQVSDASPHDIETALAKAADGFADWSGRPVAARVDLLRKVADLYEQNAPEFFALLSREGGKTLGDGVSEVREAADFLRYYAGQAEKLGDAAPRGIFACISPWNFPLAIFTGQIAAALASGNAVLAKPAEETPLIATRAVQLMHEAGIPVAAIQLLPGDGPSVGAVLTGDRRIAGICFTGSLETAKRIDLSMAPALAPDAPLIAETGGLNAMIVDSTALPEQAVRDILASAFQSAGQRCSALRILYVQEEAAERTIDMLKGAMDEWTLGDPWQLSTDSGPVINAEAQNKIADYIHSLAGNGQLLKQIRAPKSGRFIGPAVLKVSGIEALKEEIFGPVLHVATFKADEIDAVIDAINASGYGLTFGLHTRISARVRAASERVHAGNIYVNRNQIGAVVGSQPFGGEGLSGTGPKAGGPHYVARFTKGGTAAGHPRSDILPGPTGEKNELFLRPRGTVLCLGPTREDVAVQVKLALGAGNGVHVHVPGAQAWFSEWPRGEAPVQITEAPFSAQSLAAGFNTDVVAYFGNDETLRALRIALSRRSGAILPLLTSISEAGKLFIERHVCIDTTAAGGNSALLALAGE